MAGAPSAWHAARRAVGEMLDPQGLSLVACSGGADSLALATAAAWHHQRTTGPSAEARLGGVVVDHHLHPDSEEVAGRTVGQLKDLGLDPVRIFSAEVDPASPVGPEAAARTGRYRAFRQAMADLGASTVLLAHTKDDQAEQVLLGLARGSGTRSLAGIPAARGPFRRPLLELSRADTEAICAHHQLKWWNDPANADPRFLRSKVRAEILPYLERELSGTVKDALVRTARIAADDADYMESQAKEVFPALLEDPDPTGTLRLHLKGLRAQPPAIRRRVIALAVAAAGGANPSFERLTAAEKLVTGSRSAGPVEMEGHVRIRRGARQTPDYGKLVVVPPSG
ncbi:tRNA lysidine(34) synthetase TilS [Nesterenkonia sphaerica]|uniref:tRNA(Ile)-lysidine synthase n=1 Tax=Nesterenkonia sphaerica TaxID=1804988 RepID=A0A5R9A249_9MICC|nr:tRNA lysidine(34) synthetase TilS [Nesterenkonia sphaerica]TLP72759.1 tRNA lysidine(34) synthetase TilS [Nesterenkonia sphaerica]